MGKVFWTGKLSWPMKILVNLNCLLAWVMGATKNTPAMKHRMRLGYSGTCTEHVNFFDEIGLEHYTSTAEVLLKGIHVKDKTVIDVGCGTGIVSFLALEKGAVKVLGVDLSRKMLETAQNKGQEKRLGHNAIEFKQIDAESLKVKDKSFQVAISGLMLGLVPNQLKVIKEMARVLEDGGFIGISTHGPRHYWEANDATFRAIRKRRIIGYRAEFWPQNESEIRLQFRKAGLVNIRTSRMHWQQEFDTTQQAYDFFAATSSAWWFSKFPAHERIRESRKIRWYFMLKDIKKISFDVVFAYGQKPK